MVIDGRIGAIDDAWYLARVDFAGGQLWTHDKGLPVGQRVRVRILARDVSLATQRSEHSSIQNVMRGRVDAIAQDEHPGLTLVRVYVGDTAVISRVTKRALDGLGVHRDDSRAPQVLDARAQRGQAALGQRRHEHDREGADRY